MYPSIVADFIAEIHLHLALFFCGACGYLFIKRTKDVCPRRAVQPLPKKLSFDSEDVGEKEDQDAHDEAGEAEAEEDTLVSEAAVAEPSAEAAAVEELKPVAATADAQEERPEVAAAPQVSERTARILAKKAERKARKAQERLEAQIKAEMEEKTVDIPAIEAPVADSIPAMAAVKDATVPLTEEVATVEEVAPAADSVDEVSPAEELVPVASTEVVAPVDEESTPSVENMVVAEASPVALEDEEANSMLNVPLATPKSKVEWYTVEEPDHGLCCAEPELSTTWERSSAELEETEGSSCTGGFEEEEEQQMQDTTWHKHQSSWRSWKKEPTSFVDPWEMPWDELLRSREEAEEVYSQLYEQIMQAQEAQQPAQFKPVLCEDNQQLYTDGQQFYMLACITEAEGADDGAMREVVAITDAQDPLHAQFAAASPAGYVNMSLPDDDVEPEA